MSGAILEYVPAPFMVAVTWTFRGAARRTGKERKAGFIRLRQFGDWCEAADGG
jgi:hypothetical protein